MHAASVVFRVQFIRVTTLDNDESVEDLTPEIHPLVFEEKGFELWSLL